MSSDAFKSLSIFGLKISTNEKENLLNRKKEKRKEELITQHTVPVPYTSKVICSVVIVHIQRTSIIIIHYVTVIYVQYLCQTWNGCSRHTGLAELVRTTVVRALGSI
jgi:hypothetical protein